MVSTKNVSTDLNVIENNLKNFSGDMVRIEYLENCLRQLGLPNDVKRFCHLKLSDLYAYRLMWALAARNMDAAAECATTYKDKIIYYQKEIEFLIKIGDYLLIDKAFKKALICGTDKEKEAIKFHLKQNMVAQAKEHEKKNKRSAAYQIYERLLDMPIINDNERKDLMAKLASLNSGLGRIKEAIRYEQMMKRPIEPKHRDPDSVAKRISFEDLGIDRV